MTVFFDYFASSIFFIVFDIKGPVTVFFDYFASQGQAFTMKSTKQEVLIMMTKDRAVDGVPPRAVAGDRRQSMVDAHSSQHKTAFRFAGACTVS